MLRAGFDDVVCIDREKRLIECLLERPGRCMPVQRLRCIAGPVSPISLRVSMSNLRRKLSDGIWIKAMPQEGYVLERLPIAPGDCEATQDAGRVTLPWARR